MIDDKDEEYSELEKEFIELRRDIEAKIQAQVDLATEHLNAAIAIAERHGIPFYSNVSHIAQSYTPESFCNGKFATLSWEITEASEYPGWRHSDVC